MAFVNRSSTMIVKKVAVKKKPKAALYVSDFVFEPPTGLELGYKASEYVVCKIQSVSVASPLNFEWPAVPTEVTLAMIKDAITKRHGGAVVDVVLFRDQATPECILAGKGGDDGATLRDLGVRGLVSGSPSDLPVLTILYDYSSGPCDDPLVSVEPSKLGSRYGINMKDFAALDKREAAQRAEKAAHRR